MEAGGMDFNLTADRTRYLKENLKEVEEMRKEAEYRRTIEIAHTFILMGDLSYEKIAEGTGLPLEVIKELAKKKDSEQVMWDF